MAACVAVLALAGCSSAPKAPPSHSQARAPAGAPAARSDTTSDDTAQGITVYAIGLVGTPYRYGGNTPEGGFDCSGLISHVYQRFAAVRTPRSVAAISAWAQPIDRSELRTGDLVVFHQGNTNVANHAGIYVGEGRFVHAPSSGGKVRLDNLASSYWSRQPTVYRRVLLSSRG